jgi:hypothetical protein
MTNPSKQPSGEIPPRKEDFTEKFKGSLNDLRANENMSRLMSKATENTRDTISYIILITGIVLLFFSPLYGGALVGLVAGFYFSSEILAFWKHLNDFVDDEGIVKSLVGLGLLLALFISAPVIFIAMILAVIVRQVIFPEPKK